MKAATGEPFSGYPVVLYIQPQVLLVDRKKAEAFIQKNKSSFDIMEEATSTAKKTKEDE